MPTTYSILSERNEPSFNLAVEEYLLRNKSDDFQFFYINTPSVIIGKHQNALAEINLPYLEKNNIPLYRRLSGGGTVFHDKGNINFCFIKNGEQSNLVDFKKATEPIVNVLNAWGIPVRNGERNDLLVDYKKISGNACHVFKRRVMHHGTLLFDADLEALTDCLKNDPLKFKDKAVKSVRSEVVNLKPLILQNWDAQKFLEQLVGAMKQERPELVSYSFTKEDLHHIHELQSSKYDQNDWNYRYGPSYEFNKRSRLAGYVFALSMKVEKGKMTEISLKTNHPEKDLNIHINRLLHMKYHDKQEILNSLSEIRGKLDLSERSLLSLFF
ncbi:lipoate--protein ligase family protein [Geofilum rubicundum]|uniref:Lipoate-protein ligase A n=1 Tax=Geofilum rubicundum JCM 15548 TaxID=1236989 RepID=A0A0E9M0C8_9BACT|nr:lipoate--protein ligase [Geofilum rubicundum]GAO31287.1 lipoate-protein ligase A [Geofilum rubicundum JCM 15548]